MDRRTFNGLLAATALGGWGSLLAVSGEPARKKIAFLGTVVHQHSHAQHFLDRLAMGYAWRGQWQPPRVELASVHIAQFPEKGDLGRSRLEKYRLSNANSVREALTLGGPTLAVDGVFLIGEHGDYPRNELGQTRYPRYAWFKEIVKVF